MAALLIQPHFSLLPVALGEIGVCEGSLLDQLLWAVQFEKLPAVRAEACHALATLGVREKRAIHTLRDRLTVEDDPLVLRQLPPHNTCSSRSCYWYVENRFGWIQNGHCSKTIYYM